MKILVTISVVLFLLVFVEIWPVPVSAEEQDRGIVSSWTSKTTMSDLEGDAEGVQKAERLDEGVTDTDIVIETSALPEMEKDEMVEIITVRLDVYPEILALFPNLSAGGMVDGEIEYFYRTETGKKVSLIDLDKETLFDLFVRIGSAAARMNAEHIAKLIRQQEMIRSLQSLQDIPRIPASVPVPPPVVQQMRAPAQPPRIPAAPPRIPAGPPRR